jgi:hypothetical protein
MIQNALFFIPFASFFLRFKILKGFVCFCVRKNTKIFTKTTFESLKIEVRFVVYFLIQSFTLAISHSALQLIFQIIFQAKLKLRKIDRLTLKITTEAGCRKVRSKKAKE